MVVKKRISFFISFLLIFSLITGFLIKPAKSKSQVVKYRIGISQIAEHPALDLAREGFIDGLKSKGLVKDENIDIEIQNAQGDIATAQMIAQGFAAEKKDLIFAIATPSAQTAYNTTKKIPIMVTAITDAVSAGIMKSKEDIANNIAGTSDAVPIAKQLKLLKELLPEAKKLGIIYNTSELNSEIQVENIKRLVSQYDLELISMGVNNSSELSQTLDHMVNIVDVLYIPTDNLIASSMPLIYSKFSSKNKPIFGAEEAHVKSGALATEGINYYQLGFEAALMGAEVLNGRDIKTMSVQEIKDAEIVINKEVAEKLNILIPQHILDKSKVIEGVQ